MERSVRADRIAVRIEPWGSDDLPLLRELLGDPEMTKHIGGPEGTEQLSERQVGYQEPGSRQYRIVVEVSGERVGWVGYWDRTWSRQHVWEIGWSVLPRYQGRGIASSATAQLVELARAESGHRFVHAYPSIENAPSNAICRKLDFTLLGEVDFEYPPGRFNRCNDWRLDLFRAD